MFVLQLGNLKFTSTQISTFVSVGPIVRVVTTGFGKSLIPCLCELAPTARGGRGQEAGSRNLKIEPLPNSVMVSALYLLSGRT